MFCSDYKGLDNFGSDYRGSHYIDVYRKCTSLIGTENFESEQRCSDYRGSIVIELLHLFVHGSTNQSEKRNISIP